MIPVRAGIVGAFALLAFGICAVLWFAIPLYVARAGYSDTSDGCPVGQYNQGFININGTDFGPICAPITDCSQVGMFGTYPNCTSTPYSQAAYYSQATYYSQASYYTQATYYSQAGYYSQSGYYTQATYYSQSTYYTQSTYYSQAGYYSQSTYTPTGPDLIAGTTNPSSTSSGSPITISATVTNQGNASTGTSFTNLLQKASDASGTGSADIASASMGTLAAGAFASASFSYTFPAGDAGTTKYLRVCADKSSAGDAGIISETNETNNCGPWTAISVTNGTTHTLARTYNTSGIYGMTVTATDGSGNSVTANCSPNFNVAACTGTPSAMLVASPSRVNPGGTTQLSVTVLNVVSGSVCTITGTNGFTATTSPTSCSYTAGPFTTTANTAQTVYTISCPGLSSSSVTPAVVNIIPKFKEF